MLSQDTLAYLDACPFCDIARGRDDKATVLWQNDKCVALFPLEPATLGHTLIIPKSHVEDLWKADNATASSLIKASVVVGNAIHKALHPDGMNLITSAGKIAEQTIFHLHLHLVPRWQDDHIDKIWPDDGITDLNALQAAAQKIIGLIDLP